MFGSDARSSTRNDSYSGAYFITARSSKTVGCSVRFCEHGVATGRLGRWDLLLQYVPVFHHLPILKTENIYGHHRFWTPTGVTPMDHDEVALRDRHAGFIRESGKRRNQFGYGGRTIRDHRIVLFVVARK